MGFLSSRAGILALAIALPAWLPAQAPQADATLPLFTVMAAAAALDTNNVYSAPLAKQLRQDLAGKNLASLEEIRRFLSTQRGDLPASERNDPLRAYSRLVSFALVIDGPPDFSFRVRETELPPDAVSLMGLNPLLAAFYQEAQLDKLWAAKYQQAHLQIASQYQDGIARVMLEVNGYLRSSTAGYLGRSFSVYVDALGPLNQVNARSFGSDYYVVVAPSAEVQLDEVRHGYLHYVLEPLASKHSSLLREKQGLLQAALRAPALDPVLKTNFKLFLSECLIRAAELRIMKPPKGAADSERQKRVDEAAVEGFFLTPYFYEALTKFEGQDAGIRLYYPTLIEKLDAGREEKRAEKIAFRSSPTQRQLSEVNVVAARLAGIADEVERLLAEGEDSIARQDYAGARVAYRAALERSTSGATSNESRRARALYGLALVATQEKQPEVAKNYFQQTLEAAREPQLLAWAHIYLGRLLDMENRRDLAMRHYRQALESGDINSIARQAAQKGLDAPFQKSKGVIE